MIENVGYIPQEIANYLPFKKPGNITLSQEVIEHVEKEHGEQIKNKGFKNVKEFINLVINKADSIYQGKTERAFDIVARGLMPNGRIIARIEFSEEGANYPIKTAMLIDGRRYKKKTSLWEKAQISLSHKENPLAARRASQRGQSEDGNNVNDNKEKINTIIQKIEIFESATNILGVDQEISDWSRDCVSGNFPEIGQSALCVDLEDGRIFREYEPFGEVTPKDENTVVISVFSGQDAIPENEDEKRQMMWKIEREARTSLVEALIEREEQKREQENERKLNQKDEQAQKKGRGR